MIPTLRPFQQEANNRVVAAAQAGHRVIVLQSATGSGKTVMAGDLVRRARDKDKRVLLIVHRRRLVDQISDGLIDFQIDHGILMRGHRFERPAKVQVASRDTMLSSPQFELPPADLVIVDEGRHAAAPEFRRLLEPYEKAVKVLLDATPVGPDGNGLGPWATALIQAAKVTDLVRDGYLVPVRCFAPDRLNKKNRRIRGVCGELVGSWQRYAQGLPTILFCSRVQHSKEAVEAFQAAGIPAWHVDADTPDEQRDSIFRELETGQTKVVSNVGIVKEGVDIPCLGCCQIFMDPPGRVGFLQACGRIMRPFPGKPHGILIDHAGSVFRHGFPDEDTLWTLSGNVDAEFEAKHQDEKTAKVNYCKKCQLMYQETTCPQCRTPPAKPPRSIFAPPPQASTHELLTEAKRQEARVQDGPAEQERHWLRCLGVAAGRKGTFGMAAAIYKRKYGSWPKDSFRNMPKRYQWRTKVSEVFPGYGKVATQEF